MAEAPFTEPELEQLRAQFPALRQRIFDQPLVYLDNAATVQKPAVVIDETELSGSRLAGVVDELLGDRARLATMSQAVRRLARPDAAARIVDRLLELAGG